MKNIVEAISCKKCDYNSWLINRTIDTKQLLFTCINCQHSMISILSVEDIKGSKTNFH